MGFQSQASLWASPQAGPLWESHVVGQWLRWRDWQRPAASLWYWQDRFGNEVDLLLDVDQKLVAIECKLSAHPEPGAARGIQKLRDFYGRERVGAAFVACTSQEPFDLGDGVLARSGWHTWEI